MWWSGSKTEESCHILNDSVILMNMRRVGEFARNSETVKKFLYV